MRVRVRIHQVDLGEHADGALPRGVDLVRVSVRVGMRVGVGSTSLTSPGDIGRYREIQGDMGSTSLTSSTAGSASRSDLAGQTSRMIVRSWLGLGLGMG